MTRLTKPVARLVDGRLVVTLAPDGIHLRYFRTRTEYVLPWGVAMLRAGWLAAERTREERRQRRTAKAKRGLLRAGAA